MTAGLRGTPKAFRMALLVSVILHGALLLFVFASPSLSRSPSRGLVQYVNFLGPGGGPGGGGGTPAGPGGNTTVVPTPPPPPKGKASLKDLTVAEKLDEKGGMRFPVDKPKTKPGKKPPEKKATITKGDQTASPEGKPAAGAPGGQEGGTGSGFGLRFGTGGGPGGGGTGPGGTGGGGDPFGVSGFPFQYYLQIISDRITANWFSSLVDPGTSGTLQAQVGFRIYRNGQVSDLKVEFSSGIEAFDLSAQRAVQSSAPFPALPSEYDGQFLVIHLIFEHAKQP